MSDGNQEILDTNDDVDFTQCLELFRQRDMADAYIRITQEMGPSEQLIAFINYDGNLSQEMDIGLESFSLDTQHELLVQHLDVAAMEAMAFDEWMDGIKKYRKRLLVGGFLLPIAAVAASVGIILTTGNIGASRAISTVGFIAGRGGMIAGIVGIIANMADKPTLPYSNFTHYKKQFEDQFKQLNAFITAMPSSASNDAWAKFNEKFDQGNSGTELSEKLIPFNRSGWTVENYHDAGLWMFAQGKNVMGACKKLADNIGALEAKLKDGEKGTAAVKAIAHSQTLVKNTSATLKDVETLLKKVNKHFEKKKD